MAGRVPLVLVKEKQNGRTWSGRRLLIFEINRLPKNGPPGRNLGITLKINKWAALLKETACNKMKSTT
jgi:hypothetical protein